MEGTVGKGVRAVERGLPWMDTRQDEARQYVAIGYSREGETHACSPRREQKISKQQYNMVEEGERPCQQQNVQNIQCSKRDAAKTARVGQKVGIT